MPGFFMSNYPGGMIQRMPPNNACTLALPMVPSTPLPLLDSGDDTGLFVKAILTQRDKLLGKRVLAATDYYTPVQMMDIFRELYPEDSKEAKYVQLSKEEYKNALKEHMHMPEHGAQELYENMMFMDEFGYFGKASLDESHAVSIYVMGYWVGISSTC